MLCTSTNRRCIKGSSFTNIPVNDASDATTTTPLLQPFQQTRWNFHLRADESDRVSSIFELEPYGVARVRLPGIDEVLFNSADTAVEDVLKEVRGLSDEGAIQGSETARRQHEDLGPASEHAPLGDIPETVGDGDDGNANPDLASIDDGQPRHNDMIEDEEASPSKRETVIDHGDKPIWGRFSLLDGISLSTTTGDIAVTINPQPSDDPMNPSESAGLRIRSQSGNISISFTFPQEMERQMNASESESHPNPHTLARPTHPYEIDIETETGTIKGQFPISKCTRLFTKTGNINAILVPLPLPQQTVSILTETTSGSQQVHLTDPVYLPGCIQGVSSSPSAQATHISHGGGSIQIRYPSNWAGTVRANPGSGSVSLAGQRMEVVHGADGLIEGRKDRRRDEGRGKWWGASGEMDVSLGSSGAVMFYVG